MRFVLATLVVVASSLPLRIVVSALLNSGSLAITRSSSRWQQRQRGGQSKLLEEGSRNAGSRAVQLPAVRSTKEKDQNEYSDDRPSGSFFNPVPVPPSPLGAHEGGHTNSSSIPPIFRVGPARGASTSTASTASTASTQLTQRPSPRTLQPSNSIHGPPSHKAGRPVGMGFRNLTTKTNNPIAVSVQRDGHNNKPYIGIGPVLNDATKPEYDEQGYTLYADEATGKRSRVFEALVDYPCLFTIKIVGANQGAFLQDMLSIVATTCGTQDVGAIQHRVKRHGKWTSITIEAPVQNAQMLYQLYENIDKDPRVRFKF